MIDTDQPIYFDERVISAVSSVSDGQMQHGWAESETKVNANREAFLNSAGLKMNDTVLVRVRYEHDATYDKIKDVDSSSSGSGMYKAEGEASDCLVTNTLGLGLFLPVADCGATILHDPIKKVIALAHLGRHSTVAHLASKLVVHLKSKYGSNPRDLIIWVSPSIQKPSYIMKTVDFAQKDKSWEGFYEKVGSGFAIDVQGFNRALFIKSGVLENNIYVSSVDTATDFNYWSHYKQTTVNNNIAPPRFAVVVALKHI